MGKAEIISEAGAGLYTVTVLHDTATADMMLARMAMVISFLDGTLAKTTDPKEIATLKLRKAGIEKRIAAITEARNADFQTEAWCADFTNNLSGIVGTIEPGAEHKNGINIRPGYVDKSVFDKVRDGQATPFLTLPVADAMRNFAIMPAIQKWRPTYRYGVVSNVDKENSTCSVNLDGCWSSIQNLDVNHQTHFDDVLIEYMNCNGEAFENGDHVLVRWEPYKTTGQVKVIGFRDHPKPCQGGPYVIVTALTDISDDDLRAIVIWDTTLGDYARHDDWDGLEWPLSWNQVKAFVEALELIGTANIWNYSAGAADLESVYLIDPQYFPECREDDGWSGNVNEGHCIFDDLNNYTWYHHRTLDCYEENDCEQYGWENGSINQSEVVVQAISHIWTEAHPWNIESWYLAPVAGPIGMHECRIQYEVNSDGDKRLFLRESGNPGDCAYDLETTIDHYYRMVTPVGDEALRVEHTRQVHHELVNPEIQLYEVWNSYTLRDWKQYIRSKVSDHIMCQIFAIYCRRGETELTSDGGISIPDGGTSEYETVRDEYVNEWAVIATVDHFPNESGTAQVDPTILSRDSKFEEAVRKLLQTVHDAGHPAENLGIAFRQNEEEE